jgi:hypothetical protein
LRSSKATVKAKRQNRKQTSISRETADAFCCVPIRGGLQDPARQKQGKEIKTADFDMSEEKSQALYENGVRASAAFLIMKWNFADHTLHSSSTAEESSNGNSFRF